MAVVSLLRVNCPPSEPKSARKPPYANNKQAASVSAARRRSSSEAAGYNPGCGAGTDREGKSGAIEFVAGGSETSMSIRVSSRLGAQRPMAMVKENSSSGGGSATFTRERAGESSGEVS